MEKVEVRRSRAPSGEGRQTGSIGLDLFAALLRTVTSSHIPPRAQIGASRGFARCRQEECINNGYSPFIKIRCVIRLFYAYNIDLT
jgi:hypothetical protein